MTYTTTLKALHKHGACIDGYNRLAYYLKGEPYRERDTSVRFRHDDPIPLSTILESNGLDDALWALRAVEPTPELVRDCRLFAAACARQVQHLLTDPRSLASLDVAERYANGLATDDELGAARDAAWNAAWDAAQAARDSHEPSCCATPSAAEGTFAAARAAAGAAADDAVKSAAWAVAVNAALAVGVENAVQSELFKRYFCEEQS